MRRCALVIAIGLVAAAPAAAQIGNPAGLTAGTRMTEPGTPAPGQNNAQDQLFVYLIGTGGMAETAAAKMADGKASGAAIKDFARRMMQDHSKANSQLANVVQQSNLQMPKDLDPDHKEMSAQLDKLSGAQFDLAYMQGQLVDHQKTLQILQYELSYGENAALQRFAADNMPIVTQHLEMVQAILGNLTGAGPQGLAASSMPATTGGR